MQRRFGDDAMVEYLNVEVPEVQATYAILLNEIDSKGLLFPVTVIAGIPVYDGAVSYPAIMRVVSNTLLGRENAIAG